MSSLPDPTSFEALNQRYRITARIVTITALRVGAGKAQDPEATDLPILRDARGRPFLPGSSVKGALRSGLERVLRGLGRRDFRACNVLDDHARCTAQLEERAKRKRGSVTLAEVRSAVCTTCGLFGSPLLGGRFFVHDLPLSDGERSRTEVRDCVGINRDLRVAHPTAKYDIEAVPPGTAFTLEILLENADEVQLALTLQTLNMLNQGQIQLGGVTSRGLGRVRLEPSNSKLQQIDAQALLLGQGFTDCPWEQAMEKSIETLTAVLAVADSEQT